MITQQDAPSKEGASGKKHEMRGPLEVAAASATRIPTAKVSTTTAPKITASTTAEVSAPAKITATTAAKEVVATLVFLSCLAFAFHLA